MSLPSMWRITRVLLLMVCCNLLVAGGSDSWASISMSNDEGDYKVQITDDKGERVANVPFLIERDCLPCIYTVQFRKTSKDRGTYNAYTISGVDSLSLWGEPSLYSGLTRRTDRQGYFLEMEGKSNLTLQLVIHAQGGSLFQMQQVSFEQVYTHLNKTNRIALSIMAHLDQLMVGFLLMFLLLNLVSYRITRSRDYLFYSCYILTLCVYYAVRQEYCFFNDLFNLFQEAHFISSLYISRVLMPIIFLFYFLFINSFFQTFDEAAFLEKGTRLTTVLSLVSPIVIYICYASGMDSVGTWVFTIYRVSMSLLSLVFVWYMFRRKIFSSTYFIIAGSLSLFIGSLMAMIFSWTGHWFLGIAPIHWLLISVLLEILFFSSGLLFKANQTEQYKNSIQESLLTEMKKNRDHQIQKEIDLQNEIKKVKTQIEIETNEKLSVKYELESKDLELKLLRRQMNPHFLFNSMNSLKRYILENEVDNAADYLDSFSRLFRYIFDNMQRKFVNLSDELDFLKEYVRLEDLRFSDKIAFEIKYSPELNLNDIMIPSLIMQPLVENSIWHGLSESENPNKHISLNIYKRSSQLIIEVYDNGVGYADLSLDETIIKRRINSTSVNRQRLKALYGDAAWIEISSKEVGGTLVTISIPLD